MTSLGAAEIVRENYMPCSEIQGQVYHLVGSLMPVSDAEAQFLQIYFIGRESEEIYRRMRITTNVDRGIVAKLQRFLHKHNELVRLFKTILPQMESVDFEIIIRADKKPMLRSPPEWLHGNDLAAFSGPGPRRFSFVSGGFPGAAKRVREH